MIFAKCFRHYTGDVSGRIWIKHSALTKDDERLCDKTLRSVQPCMGALCAQAVCTNRSVGCASETSGPRLSENQKVLAFKLMTGRYSKNFGDSTSGSEDACSQAPAA